MLQTGPARPPRAPASLVELDGQVLTTAEVARLCGVSALTVRRWIAEGRIPALVTPGRQYRVAARELVRLAALPRPGDRR